MIRHSRVVKLIGLRRVLCSRWAVAFSLFDGCSRHGTTSLFAALDVASGSSPANGTSHRTAEFLNFLKEIDAQGLSITTQILKRGAALSDTTVVDLAQKALGANILDSRKPAVIPPV